MTTNNNDKEIIEIWKTVIGVQMHFNDISMRIRSMFVTILLALFASLGFLLDKKIGLSIGKYQVQFAAILPLFGIFGAYLFYFIDRYWYHRLLVGSVKQGRVIEKKYKSQFPELLLTEAIGEESPHEPRRLTKFLAKMIVSDEKFLNTGKLHSEAKVEFFYKSVMVALLITAIIIAIFGGIAPRVVTIEKEAVRIEGTKADSTILTPQSGQEVKLDSPHKPTSSQMDTKKSSEVSDRDISKDNNASGVDAANASGQQSVEARLQDQKK